MNDLTNELKINCSQCCGLCCVALFFSKTDGFPHDKVAGKPCINLMKDFRCSIHSQLFNNKMKGCIAYDCFGAGQKVTQIVYHNESWHNHQEMFDVYFIVYQLHQMIWYLNEAYHLTNDQAVQASILLLIKEADDLSRSQPQIIVAFEIDEFRKRVNVILKTITSKLANNNVKIAPVNFGKKFNGANLDGYDFSMNLLIGSNLEGCSLINTNFLGADLRDVNLKNTDMSTCLFLTQGQINGALGNTATLLPKTLTTPTSWIE